MGIYDREYYREKTRGSGWLSGTAPAVKAIIIANIVLFLLPKLFPQLAVLYDWFSLESAAILEKGQVWRLVTAAFLHDQMNLMHVAFNMLFLWFVGREMESFYGTREFWWLYLSAAVVSSLCWVFVNYSQGGQGRAYGASGAVMTIVSLYTFYNPRREVILFIFPVEMWLVLAIYVLSDLFSLMGRSTAPVGFAAHLGGFAYAVAFKTFDLRLIQLKSMFRRRPRLRIVNPPDSPRAAPAPRPSSKPTWSPEPAASASARPSTTAVVTEEQLEAKLDELLVKIAQVGRDGLSDEEKRVLEEASRRARNKRSGRV
jgi:membrane associated rhomboid family serine protease